MKKFSTTDRVDTVASTAERKARVVSDAFYHSMVNFSTLGYGDFVMSEKHKLLGSLEAINGVLMIGASTAALMAAIQDSIKRTIQARQGKL